MVSPSPTTSPLPVFSQTSTSLDIMCSPDNTPTKEGSNANTLTYNGNGTNVTGITITLTGSADAGTVVTAGANWSKSTVGNVITLTYTGSDIDASSPSTVTDEINTNTIKIDPAVIAADDDFTPSTFNGQSQTVDISIQTVGGTVTIPTITQTSDITCVRRLSWVETYVTQGQEYSSSPRRLESSIQLEASTEVTPASLSPQSAENLPLPNKAKAMFRPNLITSVSTDDIPLTPLIVVGLVLIAAAVVFYRMTKNNNDLGTAVDNNAEVLSGRTTPTPPSPTTVRLNAAEVGQAVRENENIHEGEQYPLALH